jgi:hypothetical protein
MYISGKVSKYVSQRRVAKGVYSLDIPQLDTISDPAKERLIFKLNTSSTSSPISPSSMSYFT